LTTRPDDRAAASAARPGTARGGPVDSRKLAEAAFHDRLRADRLEQRWSPEAERRVAGAPEWANFKWYSVERRSLAHMHAWLSRRVPGKRVLDYCCGNGADAFRLADLGAREVIGIDISETSVENCRRQAAAMGYDGVVSFAVMDAERTEFPDTHFDVIAEYGALHHLDLHRALPELARILRPDGAVICAEVLGHNPLIRWYRRATPHLRTPWESAHILTRRDLRLARRHFASVETACFHLATLAAAPFRRTVAFPAMLSVLEAVDRVLLRLPWLKWQAWMAVSVLAGPRA
jgi:ubiquinone/menaquinone biosynthesis C-methylase UbiE